MLQREWFVDILEYVIRKNKLICTVCTSMYRSATHCTPSYARLRSVVNAANTCACELNNENALSVRECSDMPAHFGESGALIWTGCKSLLSASSSEPAIAYNHAVSQGRFAPHMRNHMTFPVLYWILYTAAYKGFSCLHNISKQSVSVAKANANTIHQEAIGKPVWIDLPANTMSIIAQNVSQQKSPWALDFVDATINSVWRSTTTLWSKREAWKQRQINKTSHVLPYSAVSMNSRKNLCCYSGERNDLQTIWQLLIISHAEVDCLVHTLCKFPTSMRPHQLNQSYRYVEHFHKLYESSRQYF